jgi:acetyl esterase/lipase
MPAAKLDAITIEPRADLKPRLRIYRPNVRRSLARSTAALYWIHGGGMIIGTATQNALETQADVRKPGIMGL